MSGRFRFRNGSLTQKRLAGVVRSGKRRMVIFYFKGGVRDSTRFAAS